MRIYFKYIYVSGHSFQQRQFQVVELLLFRDLLSLYEYSIKLSKIEEMHLNKKERILMSIYV